MKLYLLAYLRAFHLACHQLHLPSFARLARQFLEKIGVIAGYTAGGVPGAIAAKVGTDAVKGASTTMVARKAIKPGIRSQSAPIIPATSAAISDEIMRERRPEPPIR